MLLSALYQLSYGLSTDGIRTHDIRLNRHVSIQVSAKINPGRSATFLPLRACLDLNQKLQALKACALPLSYMYRVK